MDKISENKKLWRIIAIGVAIALIATSIIPFLGF